MLMVDEEDKTDMR